MYYHASQTGGIQTLLPRVSNHKIPLVYFSTKRENTLVYLSNAIEKHCLETGYPHSGPWKKWGSYGFTKDGVLRLEEYYPNATKETYEGVSGYLYGVEALADAKPLAGIPFAVSSEHPVNVQSCEFIPDAYAAILAAAAHGKILLERYETLRAQKLAWIRDTMRQEYRNCAQNGDYRHFLLGKFPFLQQEAPAQPQQ